MLSHGRIELAPAPFLLARDGGAGIDIGLRDARDAAGDARSSAGRILHERARACASRSRSSSIPAAAGLFVVPIFAAVQAWAGEDRRARVVGAVNALNYIGMVGGSLVTMILLQLVGLARVDGASSSSASPTSPRRSISSAACRPTPSPSCCARSGASCSGSRSWAENLPPPASASVIAINHVSFLDAPIMLSLHGHAAGLRDRPRHRAALVGEALSSASPTRAPLDPSRPLARARAGARGARRASGSSSSPKGASPSPAG